MKSSFVRSHVPREDTSWSHVLRAAGLDKEFIVGKYRYLKIKCLLSAKRQQIHFCSEYQVALENVTDFMYEWRSLCEKNGF